MQSVKLSCMGLWAIDPTQVDANFKVHDDKIAGLEKRIRDVDERLEPLEENQILPRLATLEAAKLRVFDTSEPTAIKSVEIVAKPGGEFPDYDFETPEISTAVQHCMREVRESAQREERQRAAEIVEDMLCEMYFSANLISKAKQRILDGTEAEKPIGVIRVDGDPRKLFTQAELDVAVLRAVLDVRKDELCRIDQAVNAAIQRTRKQAVAWVKRLIYPLIQIETKEVMDHILAGDEVNNE